MDGKIYHEVCLQGRPLGSRRRHQHKAKRFPRKPTHKTPVDPKAVLTRRECEVLVGIASGACDEEIAKKLNISLTEVKDDVNKIYKKLNAPNRLQAVLWAVTYL